ncbi:MAG: hypothetical protein ABSD75_18330 [Terriglobales bacterium]|jgi:chromosome segregation ATPase
MATVSAAPEETTALDHRILAATAKVRQVEGKIAEAAEELASQRELYNSACLRLAGGAHGAADDVETIRARMLKLEAKVSGLRQLLAVPKSELERCERDRSEALAHAEQERQSEAITEETEFVANKVDAGLKAVAERDKQQAIITAITGHLRTRTYLTGANKKAGLDGAYQIDRKAAGMLN